MEFIKEYEIPAQCDRCDGGKIVIAILDMNGKNGTARRIHRCKECFAYYGPVREEENSWEKMYLRK